jgi:hypothetical protein
MTRIGNMALIYKTSVLLFVLLSFTTTAKVVLVEVQAKGMGTSYDSALKSSLANAIAKVTGIEISAATTVVNESLRYADGGGGEFQANAQGTNTAVQSRVHGNIDSYEVISQKQETNGNYFVTVKAKIYKYQASATSQRKRLALLTTVHEEPTYQFFEPVNGAKISKKINRSIEQFVVQSRKFSLLTRQDLSSMAAELHLMSSPATPIKEKAKLGQVLGADLLLFSEIVEANANTYFTRSQITGQTSQTRDGILSIRIRVIDTVTSEVKFSDIYEVDASPYQNLDQAIENVSKVAIDDLVTRIYPHKLVSVEGDTVVFNAGGDTVETGSVFAVYEIGGVLIDPYTKESIGRVEQKVGLVEVSRVTSKISYAEILSGGGFKPGMVLRKQVAKTEKTIKQNKKKGIDLGF